MTDTGQADAQAPATEGTEDASDSGAAPPDSTIPDGAADQTADPAAEDGVTPPGDGNLASATADMSIADIIALSGDSSSLIQLIKLRLQALESELSVLEASEVANQTVIAQLKREIAGFKREIGDFEGQLTSRDGELQTRTPASVKSLSTLALVRAILSTEEIQQRYPDLLDAFDVYLQEYGDSRSRDGQRSAYDEVLQMADDSGVF